RSAGGARSGRGDLPAGRVRRVGRGGGHARGVRVGAGGRARGDQGRARHRRGRGRRGRRRGRLRRRSAHPRGAAQAGLEAVLHRRAGGGGAPLAAAREDVATNSFAALSDEQRAVVDAPDGRVVVLAGAGSGKTRALTHRVARLVASGARPERVLLCTFTSRAARALSRAAAELSGARDAIFAGTFHQLAHRVLRERGAAIG